MTVTNNKKLGLERTSEATKPEKSTNKDRNLQTSLPKQQKCWVFHWATYACDPNFDYPTPLETKESVHYIRPSRSDIYEMRKHMHRHGFQLMDVVEVDPNLDEF